MLRLASDADVHGAIIRGLKRREPTLDLVRAQDVGLHTAPDPVVLQWAATENRVLISRDRRTMIRHAYSRVQAGKPMPGLVVLRRRISIGDAIDEILLVTIACSEDEVRDRVIFLPV